MNASNVRTLSDTPDTFIPDCALPCAGGTVGTANKGNVTHSSGSLTVTGSTTLNRRLTQSVSERTKFNIDTSGNAAIATSLCVGTFSPYGTATTGAFNTFDQGNICSLEMEHLFSFLYFNISCPHIFCWIVFPYQ